MNGLRSPYSSIKTLRNTDWNPGNLWKNLNINYKQKIKGTKFNQKITKKRCSLKIEQLKNMAGDRIDALEREIITHKFKYNSVIENLKMNICEYESRQMNNVMTENQIQNIMEIVE